MQVEKTSAIIAHFIGYFDALTDEARLRLHHNDGRVHGRFNRSPQHPKLGGVYGDGKTEVGAINAAQIVLARSATGVAA